MNATKELQELLAKQHETALILSALLSQEALSAVHKALTNDDLDTARRILSSHEAGMPAPLTSKTDAAASDLLRHAATVAGCYALNESEVTEALLIALTRYIGPLRFAGLLSQLTPSSRA